MHIRTRLFTLANAHVLMVSFLLGGSTAFLIGLQQSLAVVEQAVHSQLHVAVFVQPEVNDQEAEKWAHGLLSTDPDIASIHFISRDEALQKAQGNPALVKSLLLLHENPFPASVSIEYKDHAWLERPEPALALRAMPQVQEIRWDPEARSVFRSLRQWSAWLARFTAMALIILFLWCLLGVYRFLVVRAHFAELMIHLGVGLAGGVLAMATWGLALHGLGGDAALYKPETISFWPLLAALLAALATFGWRVDHEN